MRGPHICPHCEHRSTRWWNLKVHIKRKHGGFLPGTPSGRYTADNPSWFKRNNPLRNFGPATVADSIGNSFKPRFMPQQAPLRTSQYNSSPILPTPLPRMDEKYGTGLSQETIVKIEELKRLVNKYPQYNRNPDGVIRWAIQSSVIIKPR
jgi:hypothetical protein